MAEDLYTIHVSGVQLETISELFQENGWRLNLDQQGSRYLALKEIADEYVDLRTNGTIEGNGSEQRQDTQVTRRSDSGAKDVVSLPIDRSQRSFKEMKQTAAKYQTLKSNVTNDAASHATAAVYQDNDMDTRTREGTWRLSNWDPEFKGHVKSEINLQHFCVAEGNLLKVICSLSSDHIHQVSQVSVRIVLLVDRSGSMLNKLGKDARHSKITKVKHFAKQLITSLDDGDEVAVVTFGKEAEIFFPLTKITGDSRPYLEEMLNKLDKGGMSQETNLSDGLRMALKAFYEATKNHREYLSCKNSIIVFSDGEINSGTVASQSLVHEVRQNIRQMVPNLEDSQNQWVTISVITTGTVVSDQAYMLSKHCSSDAYYYIEKEAEDPEADLFIPVLLRKTAVAWNISILVEAFDNLSFVDEKCTQDFRVRLRRSLSGKRTSAEKAYFLYDFPAGHSRQIGVGIDLSQVQDLESRSDTDKLLRVRVEYSNIKGERLWQEKMINVSDIREARTHPGNIAALDAVHKHDLRLITTGVFHAAAEHVRGGNISKSKSTLMDGKRDIQAMLEKFGTDAMTAESKSGPEFTSYAKSVVDNLGALIVFMEQSSDTGSWNRIRAVSTAIARETPNTSGTVQDGDILCPLPDIDRMENKGLTHAMEKLTTKQGKQKRVSCFGDMEKFLEETLK